MPLRKVLAFVALLHSCSAWNNQKLTCRQDSNSGVANSQSRRVLLHTFIHLPAIIWSNQAAQASNLPSSTGANTSKVGTVDTLIPIVSLRSALGRIQSDLQQGQKVVLDKTIPTTEVEFKRIFDEYSDPVSYKQKFLDQNAFLVYYTKGFDGPGRENIEAGINERQTQQFGYRNEAWIAWESFLVELKFIDDADNDAALFIGKAVRALDSYLELAPLNDVGAAQGSLGVSF